MQQSTNQRRGANNRAGGRSGRPGQNQHYRRGGKRPSNGRRSSGGKNKNRKQYIDPAKFINHAVTTPTNDAPYVPKHSFTDFQLDGMIEANLAEIGFTTPSAIQDQTIPLALDGHDVIGLANTGTGKTAAFLLPIIHKLRHNPAQQSVLIMAPTRELAQQIDAEFARFARGMRLYSAVCVGGVNINPQIRQLRRRPHVIIGTPGRLKDLLERRDLDLRHIDTLVLDEADRMLDMGFINDIRQIVRDVPTDRQTLCFSATMSPEIKAIVHDFMHNPQLVSKSPKPTTTSTRMSSTTMTEITSTRHCSTSCPTKHTKKLSSLAKPNTVSND